MGYIRHHAIIVTGYSPEADLGGNIEHAQIAAEVVFGEKFPIQRSTTNGYASIFIHPDGSKEGWQTSDNGNKNRKQFLEWLEKQPAEYAWVEVEYGGDGGKAFITNDRYFDAKV